MFKAPIISKAPRRLGRILVLAASVMTMLLLAGCISSSKVYNNDKTVVYNGSMYNMANVKQIGSSISGKLEDGTIVDLKGANKKQIQKYLDQNGEMYVRMAFTMDTEELLYRAKEIDSYSDFNRMKKDYEKAGKQIADLMGSKKKRQLNLK